MIRFARVVAKSILEFEQTERGLTPLTLLRAISTVSLTNPAATSLTGEDSPPARDTFGAAASEEPLWCLPAEEATLSPASDLGNTTDSKCHFLGSLKLTTMVVTLSFDPGRNRFAKIRSML